MPSLIMCKSLSDTHNGDSQTGRTQKLLKRPLSVLIIWIIQITSILKKLSENVKKKSFEGLIILLDTKF